MPKVNCVFTKKNSLK